METPAQSAPVPVVTTKWLLTLDLAGGKGPLEMPIDQVHPVTETPEQLVTGLLNKVIVPIATQGFHPKNKYIDAEIETPETEQGVYIAPAAIRNIFYRRVSDAQ